MAWLQSQGALVQRFEGGSAAETRRLAREALAGAPDALVVAGGDGTLTGVVDLAAASGVPVVLIPGGTGNDLARALGIPLDDPERAASAALTGVVRRIDLGSIESGGTERLFLTVAALGFDARVSDRTNRLRYPRGAMRYYLALLIELVRLRPTSFRVQVDDAPPVEMPGTLLAVGSTQSYGGGLRICAGALPDDSALDFVHVAPLSRARLLGLFPLLLRGAHLGRPEVRHQHVRRVAVSADDLVVYADGERVGEGRCIIGVRPGALTMRVPA